MKRSGILMTDENSFNLRSTPSSTTCLFCICWSLPLFTIPLFTTPLRSVTHPYSPPSKSILQFLSENFYRKYFSKLSSLLIRHVWIPPSWTDGTPTRLFILSSSHSDPGPLLFIFYFGLYFPPLHLYPSSATYFGTELVFDNFFFFFPLCLYYYSHFLQTCERFFTLQFCRKMNDLIVFEFFFVITSMSLSP